MNPYKVILLRSDGANGYKTEKPTRRYVSDNHDWDAVTNAEYEYETENEQWQESGEPLEFATSELTKLWIGINDGPLTSYPVDITNLVEVKSEPCQVAKSNSMCPNIICQSTLSCCSPETKLYFKPKEDKEVIQVGKEEIQKLAALKYGACPIIEFDLHLHSRNELIEFADLCQAESLKRIEELEAKLKQSLLEDCAHDWGEVKYCPSRQGEGNECKHCV